MEDDRHPVSRADDGTWQPGSSIFPRTRPETDLNIVKSTVCVILYLKTVEGATGCNEIMKNI